jgi:hypothetical protein
MPAAVAISAALSSLAFVLFASRSSSMTASRSRVAWSSLWSGSFLLGLQGSAQRCPIDLLQVPRVCDEQRQYGCGAEPEQRNHEQHLGSRGQVRTAARDPRDATNQPCARQNRQGPLLQGALGITLDLEQVGYPLCGRFTRDRGASPRLV